MKIIHSWSLKKIKKYELNTYLTGSKKKSSWFLPNTLWSYFFASSSFRICACRKKVCICKKISNLISIIIWPLQIYMLTYVEEGMKSSCPRHHCFNKITPTCNAWNHCTSSSTIHFQLTYLTNTPKQLITMKIGVHFLSNVVREQHYF